MLLEKPLEHTMDYETVSADEFGQSLTVVGINLLTSDVRKLAAFLVGVFEATAHRLSDDFAIREAFSQFRHSIFGKFRPENIKNTELLHIADKFDEPVPDWTVSQA